jgi:hypothetical protein
LLKIKICKIENYKKSSFELLFFLYKININD